MGMLFCRAYEVFKHRRYLDAALAAGDVVWQRGLLKKGLGLCHGIAGTHTTPSSEGLVTNCAADAFTHTHTTHTHTQAMGTCSWSSSR
jgi:hypothetical protein